MAKQSLLTVSENRSLQLFMLGGFIFVFFFYLAYSNINDDLYKVRDDGVITMSHAKNWVDYGFIGVNPSGDRVEGYSAPVQFFLYATAYALTGISYDLFAKSQTAIFTFLLGAIFILFFKENRVYALVSSVIAAIILSNHTAFLQWHGSGMENPITHVLFLATVFILYTFAKKENIAYQWAIIVFLATISRIDSVYHIAPLLIIFSVYWLFLYKNLRGFYFSLIVFFLWLFYHFWRYVYFGDFLPNTAYAQGISISDRLGDWINWEQPYIDKSIKLSKQIFLHHGGYILVLITPFLFLVQKRKTEFLLFLLIVSLLMTAYLNPFIFGETRLDPVRSTTQFAVLTALAITTFFYLIENKKHIFWLAPVSLLVGLFSFKVNIVEPYYLCCSTNGFDTIRREFTNVSNKQSLPRPTISNPDLGVMSWHKQFNIVDLGMLGTPIMAHLSKSGSVLSDYFFEFAAPDLVESHGYWRCIYEKSIFNDQRFNAMYDVIYEEKPSYNCNGKMVAKGMWIRKDIKALSTSKERMLIDDLKSSLSLERLRHELDSCQLKSDQSCLYISRTAYRFIPEFKNRGQLDDLNRIFSTSRTRDYDLYLINGNSNEHAINNAIDFIVNDHISKITGHKNILEETPIINSKFRIYMSKSHLVYMKNSCRLNDIDQRFFLHITPLNKNESQTNHRYNNFDFNFVDYGFQIDDMCIAIRPIPDQPISNIRTGQFIRGTGSTWEASYLNKS